MASKKKRGQNPFDDFFNDLEDAIDEFVDDLEEAIGELFNPQPFFDEVDEFIKNTREDLGKASLMGHLAKAAYPDRDTFLSFDSRFHPDQDRIVPFEGRLFSGFVGSDESMTVVSFCGTSRDMTSVDAALRTVGQWVTNTNFAQTTVNGMRVHSGFYSELDHNFRTLVQAIKKVHRPEKTLYITGHSAGGAIATLAGQRFATEEPFEGSHAEAVYAFSGPRIGDKAFVNSYPVDLYRMERGRDLVPHLPFEPDFMNVLKDFGVSKSLIGLTQLGSQLFDIKIDPDSFLNDEVEYYHAGRLLYHYDDDDRYLRLATPEMNIFEGVAADVFLELVAQIADRQIAMRPVPDEWHRIERIMTLIFQSMDHLTSFNLNKAVMTFLDDHDIRRSAAFLAKLSGR